MKKLLPIFLGFFVMGFCDLVGIGSDYVQRSFHWSAFMAGFVPSMVFIWFLFLSIPFGNLMNRIGRKNTVLISFAVTILGTLLPLAHYNSVTCMVAFALLGIGNAILQVSLNPLLSNIITDPNKLTSSLTIGQFIKAISSLAGPEFVIVAVSLWGEEKWYLCFPMLAAITLVTALLLWRTDIEREPKASDSLLITETFALLGNKMILIFFLGILFVVGLDVSVNFISSKLMMARHDWVAEQAKYAPQVYFLCRTIGAFISSYILLKMSAGKYFRYNMIGCLVAIVALMVVDNDVANMVCIGAIGFLASAVFSIIYSSALQVRSDKANEISGLMMTAIAGAAVVTPVLGAAIESFGMNGGVAVILLCAIYLTFCSFLVKS